MRTLLLALAVSLGACVSGAGAVHTIMYGTRESATQTRLEDGRAAWEVTCDGGGRLASTCRQRAAQLCPNGYDVVASSQTSTRANLQRTLLVTCK